jgi:holo-[acyl-carrier-protein] synthase
MILGIGTDMVDVRRIEKLLHRFGDRFVCKIFTPQERAYCLKQHHPAAAFAKRFAAKEAALKALGTGLRAGITWQDFDVGNDKNGKPCLRITPEIVWKIFGVDVQNREGATKNPFIGMSGEKESFSETQAYALVRAASDKLSDAANRPRKEVFGDALDIHLSLADEQPYALAFVVISRKI